MHLTSHPPPLLCKLLFPLLHIPLAHISTSTISRSQVLRSQGIKVLKWFLCDLHRPFLIGVLGSRSQVLDFDWFQVLVSDLCYWFKSAAVGRMAAECPWNALLKRVMDNKEDAGNLGNLPLIIIPAICKEKGSPFGDPDRCHTYGMAYVALSLSISTVYIWLYAYNVMLSYSEKHSGSGTSSVGVRPEISVPPPSSNI